MIRLEELIQAQCPGGVRYASFPEVCSYIRGITYNKTQEVAETVENAHKVLRANNITLASNTLNFDDVKCVAGEVRVKDTQWLKAGDILMCASSGSQEHVGKVAYIFDDMDYTFGGFMAVIRCGADVSSKYMFHVLSSGIFAKHLKDTLKSNTIKTLNADAMNAFSFPVPPSEVQEEIVRILDDYAEKNNQLISALSSEFEARKRQYEYYRDLWLTFGDASAAFSATGGKRRIAVEWLNLGTIATIRTGSKPETIVETKTDTASYEYINAGTTSSGFTSAPNRKGDIITTPSRGQGGIGYIAYQSKEFWLGPLCYSIDVLDKTKISPKYLYYFLTSRKKEILERKKKDGVPAINASDLATIPVAAPQM